MSIFCKYQEKCSGCQLLGIPFSVQHETKTADLRRIFSAAGISIGSSLEVLSAGEAGLRDRSDLIFEDGRWGLYQKEERVVLDIDVCAQFSPALQAFLSDVRRQPWPVQKGSFRLRVSPSGQRGLWLDFANLDIKNILLEKNLLAELHALAFVEMGQRRKVPVLKDGLYKLSDPELHPWFQTWIQGQSVPLYCHVGSFTQPSLVANRLLTSTIESWLDSVSVSKVLEFGSGIGNLSFPALGSSRELVACEIDASALEGFRRSLDMASRLFPGIADRVRILQGDFQNHSSASFAGIDAVLVNPPRSGLKNFLQPLLGVSSERPRYFVYMSCFPESMALDARVLSDLGYRLVEMKIVDQFPQTSHYEVLGFWELG